MHHSAQLEVAVRAAERERDVAESLREAMRDLTDTLDPAEVEERLAARVTAVLPDSTVRVLRGGPMDGLATVTGLHDVDVRDGVLTCTADPEAMNDLLVRLARIGVHGLTCSPPSLEELFLRHYGERAVSEVAA